MAIEFDPAWEYFQADLEILEAMGASVVAFSYSQKAADRGESQGYATTPRPDFYRSRLGREKPIRQGTCLALRLCPTCDHYFRPGSDGQRHCGPSCRPPRRPRTCKACGAALRAARSRGQRFCSRACLDGAREARKRPPAPCKACGVPFRSYAPGQRFCSGGCYGLASRKGEASCLRCSRPIPYDHGSRRRTYCSEGCRGYAMKREPRPCERCGTPFTARPGQRFCSYACRPPAGGRKKAHVEPRPCGWCGAEFTPAKPALSGQRFCCKSHARSAQHAARGCR